MTTDEQFAAWLSSEDCCAKYLSSLIQQDASGVALRAARLAFFCGKVAGVDQLIAENEAQRKRVLGAA